MAGNQYELNYHSTLLLKTAIDSGITSPGELANIMGNAHVETGGFSRMHENFRYLASKARQSGVTRIDHVMLNTRGDGVIGLQGSLQDPSRQLVSVDRVQVAEQSVERSTNELTGRAAVHQQAQVHAQMQHMEHRSGLSIGMKP